METKAACSAVLAVLFGMVLTACSTPPEPTPQVPKSPEPVETSVAKAAPLAKAAPAAPALTSEGYRKQIAERIVQSSPDVFTDTLPKMLKSIVVVDITIDRDGNLRAVGIRRSNGYKALENTALKSVRQAAPFAAPPRAMRRNDGSVNFLETFLFRDDGRFQIRTLAGIQ